MLPISKTEFWFVETQSALVFDWVKLQRKLASNHCNSKTFFQCKIHDSLLEIDTRETTKGMRVRG